jgi:hypothetical protein
MASGRAVSTVAAGDQDVAQAAVAQLGEHRVPELRALGLGDPAAQRVLVALDVDTDDQVRDLDRDRALVPGFDAEPDTLPRIKSRYRHYSGL